MSHLAIILHRLIPHTQMTLSMMLVSAVRDESLQGDNFAADLIRDWALYSVMADSLPVVLRLLLLHHSKLEAGNLARGQSQCQRAALAALVPGWRGQ